jgi:carboxymethylenebutenolidase
MASITIKATGGTGDFFARVNGTHWDGRPATIANGRSAEVLAVALG